MNGKFPVCDMEIDSRRYTKPPEYKFRWNSRTSWLPQHMCVCLRWLCVCVWLSTMQSNRIKSLKPIKLLLPIVFNVLLHCVHCHENMQHCVTTVFFVVVVNVKSVRTRETIEIKGKKMVIDIIFYTAHMKSILTS